MREAGVLLHISSLPNRYGIGTLGKCAYDFIDFLKKSGQRIWQILPLGPTSYGDSPYSSTSSFAFNPYFIDLEELVKLKLISSDDLIEVNSNRVDYGYLYNERFKVLHKAFLNREILNNQFQKFVLHEDSWLNPYAEYMVLKREHENKPWYLWYDDFKYKVDHAMVWFKEKYALDILEQKFYQFLFVYQWKRLHNYAKKNGITIMGDMPIYCAYDSADVWANPENFDLNDKLEPTFVAGCPPDGFSEDGQLWGNPLYNYKFMKENNYSWWVMRVKHSLEMFDILRIDHFRGFAGFYAIPYGDTNAKRGHWCEGPGYDLFKEINKKCKNARIVAENLGFLTDDVYELLNRCGYPGMHIFEFELADGKNPPIKKGFSENSITYSGTHDNQTILSFYHEANDVYKKCIDKLCKIKFTDRAELKIIEYCMMQKSNMCIIPLQDYLGLTDSEGRMNVPSTAMGNWSYMAKKTDFSDELSKYMLKLAIKSNRFEITE